MFPPKHQPRPSDDGFSRFLRDLAVSHVRAQYGQPPVPGSLEEAQQWGATCAEENLRAMEGHDDA